MRIAWIIGAGLIAVGGWLGWGLWQDRQELAALAKSTRAGLIAVKGGPFEAGNFEVSVALAGGEIQTRPVATRGMALDSYSVVIADFALSAHEVDVSDLRVYRAATGRVSPSIDSAAMTWQEASAYCAWLGELVDLPMRLPSEVEWEYAARSRGALVPWGTADGVWPPSDAPSPMGFFGLSGGTAEWVGEANTATRIAKGGSDQSSAFYETVPSRTVVDPTDGAWPGEPVELAVQGYPYHFAYATARCAADTGGQGTGVTDFEAPEIIGPYDAAGAPIP